MLKVHNNPYGEHMTVAVPKPITFQPDIYGKVLHVLQGGKSRSVLDVGAGQGYFSRKLAEGGFRVEACDFDRDNFLCPEIPFREADLNKELPYADNSFDCVVSVEVVEHIENHFTYMSEIVRVTKPGGTIVKSGWKGRVAVVRTSPPYRSRAIAGAA